MAPRHIFFRRNSRHKTQQQTWSVAITWRGAGYDARLAPFLVNRPKRTVGAICAPRNRPALWTAQANIGEAAPGMVALNYFESYTLSRFYGAFGLLLQNFYGLL
jgi:hypothetical protein